MTTKQIYVYQTGEFFPIDMTKLSHKTIDEIIHYGLEKFLNQKANSFAKKGTHREDIKEIITCVADSIEQGCISIPHTKTLEEKAKEKIAAMSEDEKETYRRLLLE